MKKVSDQLELAVTEAASNIMRHAYQGRTDQPIQLVAEAFSDRIVIRLFHHGVVFDPETVSRRYLMGRVKAALASTLLRTRR